MTPRSVHTYRQTYKLCVWYLILHPIPTGKNVPLIDFSHPDCQAQFCVWKKIVLPWYVIRLRIKTLSLHKTNDSINLWLRRSLSSKLDFFSFVYKQGIFFNLDLYPNILLTKGYFYQCIFSETECYYIHFRHFNLFPSDLNPFAVVVFCIANFCLIFFAFRFLIHIPLGARSISFYCMYFSLVLSAPTSAFFCSAIFRRIIIIIVPGMDSTECGGCHINVPLAGIMWIASLLADRVAVAIPATFSLLVLLCSTLNSPTYFYLNCVTLLFILSELPLGYISLYNFFFNETALLCV